MFRLKSYTLFKGDNIGYLFVLPTILLLFLVIIYPLLHTLTLSFQEVSLQTKRFVGFANFVELFHSPVFWNALKNTLIFTGFSVSLHFLIGLVLALCLNKGIRYRIFFRITMLTPWMISGVVAALTWRWIYDAQFGLLNDILDRLGLIKSYYPWLGDTRLAMPAVIVANLWRGFPFVMITLLAGLQAIPQEQYEAAAIDGAGSWQSFRYITFPNLKYIIMVATLLDTIWNFRYFDLIQVITAGGPGNATEVLTTLVYRTSFVFFKFGYSSALAVTMLIILLFFAITYVKLLEQKE